MTNSDMAERQQYWLAHVKAAEASEGSQADYARANGIKARELYQWKTVLTRRGLLPAPNEESAFVSFTSNANNAGESGCTIVLPNGVRIDIQGPLVNEQLQDIVAAQVSFNDATGRKRRANLSVSTPGRYA